MVIIIPELKNYYNNTEQKKIKTEKTANSQKSIMN